jgi:hypothetical protein
MRSPRGCSSHEGRQGRSSNFASLGSPAKSPASAGLFPSPSAAGQGDFIFAYGGVAVANTDHGNVYGRSRGRLA